MGLLCIDGPLIMMAGNGLMDKKPVDLPFVIRFIKEIIIEYIAIVITCL